MKNKHKDDGCLKAKYKEVVNAFCDLLDGSRCLREICADTGLPMERCEEIWRLFKSDEIQEIWLGSIRG